jgi:cell division GTPase FtsZ
MAGYEVIRHAAEEMMEQELEPTMFLTPPKADVTISEPSEGNVLSETDQAKLVKQLAKPATPADALKRMSKIKMEKHDDNDGGASIPPKVDSINASSSSDVGAMAPDAKIVSEIPVAKPVERYSILEALQMSDVQRTLDMGIIGVGGCGNHIADAFAEVGYDVMAVNLTDRDYNHLKFIPQDEFSRIELVVGAGGAGKNPDVGAQAIKEYANSLLKKIQRKFNNKEFIFVAYGLGGGTGTIGGSLVAEIAATLNVPVGVIVTLPRKNEGTDEKVNCLRGLQEVANNKNIKSIVVIDNQKVMERLSGSQGNDFWHSANKEIVSLFDRFNTLSAIPTETAFDAEDYKKCLMTPGFLVLGSSEIQVPAVATDDATRLLNEAVAAINRGFLATGFDHKTTIRAAGVIEKPQGFDYQHSFEESLFNIIKTDIGAGGLNRGIYTTEVKSVTVNTMLAGMRLPEARVKELVEEAHKEASEMASKIEQRQTEKITIDLPASMDAITGSSTTKSQDNHLNSGLLNRRRG